MDGISQMRLWTSTSSYLEFVRLPPRRRAHFAERPVGLSVKNLNGKSHSMVVNSHSKLISVEGSSNKREEGLQKTLRRLLDLEREYKKNSLLSKANLWSWRGGREGTGYKSWWNEEKNKLGEEFEALISLGHCRGNVRFQWGTLLNCIYKFNRWIVCTVFKVKTADSPFQNQGICFK